MCLDAPEPANPTPKRDRAGSRSAAHVAESAPRVHWRTRKTRRALAQRVFSGPPALLTDPYLTPGATDQLQLVAAVIAIRRCRIVVVGVIIIAVGVAQAAVEREAGTAAEVAPAAPVPAVPIAAGIDGGKALAHRRTAHEAAIEPAAAHRKAAARWCGTGKGTAAEATATAGETAPTETTATAGKATAPTKAAMAATPASGCGVRHHRERGRQHQGRAEGEQGSFHGILLDNSTYAQETPALPHAFAPRRQLRFTKPRHAAAPYREKISAPAMARAGHA